MAESPICPRCGASNTPGAQFCSTCGHALDGLSASSTPRFDPTVTLESPRVPDGPIPREDSGTWDAPPPYGSRTEGERSDAPYRPREAPPYDAYGATTEQRTSNPATPGLIAAVVGGAILIGLLVAWFFIFGPGAAAERGSVTTSATATASVTATATATTTATDPTPTPSVVPPVDANAFPNAAEAALLEMIPEAIQSPQCIREEDLDDQEPLADANVLCGPGEPYAAVWYHGFATPELMDQAFDTIVSDSEITGGGCTDGQTRGTERWKLTDDDGQEVNSGRVLCYTTSDPSQSIVVWTDETAVVIGYVYRRDTDIGLILAPWLDGELDPIVP